MAILKRPISFIAAAKSCRRPIVGPLILGTGAIPVERPNDVAVKGKGVIIRISSTCMIGKNT
jgi:glycerol-3-phosphate O-acyltransferase/dihydroxyacetone phosphate acyltransferase